MVVDHVETDDLKVGESANDTDCYLPLCFGNQVLTWNNVLFSIILQDGAVWSGEASVFVRVVVERVSISFSMVTASFMLI